MLPNSGRHVFFISLFTLTWRCVCSPTQPASSFQLNRAWQMSPSRGSNATAGCSESSERKTTKLCSWNSATVCSVLFPEHHPHHTGKVTAQSCILAPDNCFWKRGVRFLSTSQQQFSNLPQAPPVVINLDYGDKSLRALWERDYNFWRHTQTL